MALKNKQDINNFMQTIGKNFVNGSSFDVQAFIRSDIKSNLYGNPPSQYYDRTNSIPNAIVVSSLKQTGTVRPRVSRTVSFDYRKLPIKKAKFKRIGLFGGRRTMIKFGTHMSIYNKDMRKWMPAFIEEGWSVFNIKKIEGTHSFSKARDYIKSQMKSNNVSAWISGVGSNIKIQKKK